MTPLYSSGMTEGGGRMQLEERWHQGPIRVGPDDGRGRRSLAMVTRLLEEAGHRPRALPAEHSSPDGMRGTGSPDPDRVASDLQIAALLQDLVLLFQPHAQGASLDLQLVLPEDLPLWHQRLAPHFEKNLRRFLGEVIAAGHGQVVELQLKVLAQAGASWMLALSAVAKRGDGALHVLLPRLMFYLTEDSPLAQGGLPP